MRDLHPWLIDDFSEEPIGADDWVEFAAPDEYRPWFAPEFEREDLLEYDTRD